MYEYECMDTFTTVEVSHIQRDSTSFHNRYELSPVSQQLRLDRMVTLRHVKSRFRDNQAI